MLTQISSAVPNMYKANSIHAKLNMPSLHTIHEQERKEGKVEKRGNAFELFTIYLPKR